MKGCEIMDSETREMLNLILSELKDVKTDIADLKHKVTKNSDDIKGLQNKVDGVQSDINGLHALIETETNHYVKVIAEGHEMQTEKVNNYIHAVENVRAKQELFEIRLSMLERDIQELKRA